MSDTIEIRGIRTTRGERVQGLIEIGETTRGPVRVPVEIINGAEDGPILCITAGVHATEYPPMDAVMRTIRSLEPSTLRGAVIALPVVNTAMFESRTPFVSPLDGLNLNDIAPGNPSGTISQVLAHVLLNEIIGRAKYYIDVHGGDLGEMLLPFVACLATGDSPLDREAERLARVYGPELVVVSDGRSVFPFAGSIVHAAAHKGIVALIAEAGGDGAIDERDVQIHVDGIQNVMRYLGMIEGAPRIRETGTRGIVQFVTRATRAGLVRVKVRIGDVVAEGEEVAEICNLLGETVEIVRAPRAGTAGLIWSHKVVTTGAPIVRCWVTEPLPPFPH